MLPEGFEFREMFEAIVIGVILLSTFIYALVLVSIISLNQEAFDKEVEIEEKYHH
jgi:CPA1 family monovalent cation:H+ antiporter